MIHFHLSGDAQFLFDFSINNSYFLKIENCPAAAGSPALAGEKLKIIIHANYTPTDKTQAAAPRVKKQVTGAYFRL